MSVAQDGTFLPRPGLSGTTHKGDVRVDGGLGEFFFSWEYCCCLIIFGEGERKRAVGRSIYRGFLL
jgi:hypothetical protein